MDTPFSAYQPFMQMWLDMASKMTSAGAEAPKPMPADMIKQWWDTYFQTMGQYTEQYMRSPQFLEVMKQSTDTMATLRKQANDALAQAHHAVGSLARPDADSLLMALRRCETRMLDKLDELAAKVEDLEGRLDAMESGNKKSGHKAKP